MGLFKRSEAVRAKRIGADARYVDEDVQRIDIKVTSTDGETATIDLSLDQTRQLVIDPTNAYGHAGRRYWTRSRSTGSRRSSGCVDDALRVRRGGQRSVAHGRRARGR